MFIRTTKSPDGKRIKVYLVEGYRSKEGKVKQRVIKRYGDLSDLVKKDPLILEKLKKEAKDKTKKDKIEINLNRYELIGKASSTVNYGYFFLENIYKNIGISKLIMGISDNKKFEYDLNDILKMLVFSRVLNPSSKLKSFKNSHKFFEPFNVSLQNIYRSLSELNRIKDDIQLAMHQNIKKNIGRDLSLVLYDLTNYYFETEETDELKKPGVSKERKVTPIVQMGLLIDQNKIPVGYQLFPGNTHDSKTAIPMIKKLKEKFGVKRTILTADKGINTNINFASLVKNGDGYIVSQKIRGSKKEFIDEVLNEEGYIYWGKSFKVKEVYRTRMVKDEHKNNVELKEKVVIYWSKNFDAREKHKREKLNEKIEKFLNTPSALNASNAHGIKRYIKTKHLDKETGEVQKVNPKNVFDQEKYDRDVALDGYYAIVTSELDKPIKEILTSYKELWKIEESFKVIKSDLEGRPVYVRREDRIEGHFLTCFIALTILRILETKLDYKYSASHIKESLRNATCKEFGQGIYSMEHQDEIITNLEKLCNSYIHYSISTYESIRKYKKEVVHNKIW